MLGLGFFFIFCNCKKDWTAWVKIFASCHWTCSKLLRYSIHSKYISWQHNCTRKEEFWYLVFTEVDNIYLTHQPFQNLENIKLVQLFLHFTCDTEIFSRYFPCLELFLNSSTASEILQKWKFDSQTKLWQKYLENGWNLEVTYLAGIWNMIIQESGALRRKVVVDQWFYTLRGQHFFSGRHWHPNAQFASTLKGLCHGSLSAFIITDWKTKYFVQKQQHCL